MSVTGDNDIYEKMVGDDVSEGVSSDYIYLKYNNKDEKILPCDDDTEEVSTNEQSNIFLDPNDQEFLEYISKDKQNQYFETTAPTDSAVTVDEQHYEIKLNVKEEWSTSLDNSKEEEMVAENIVNAQVKITDDSNEDSEIADDDEETIAIFATAAGQELALYRVDGSDEIYAVSLFDESGQPPTNFEYLMSSDVERLIKQGAVRTVKKPSAMKSHLITNPSPVIVKEQSQPVKQTYDYRNKPKYKNTRPQRCWEPLQVHNRFVKNTPNTIYSIVNKQPDVNYIMLENIEKEEYLEDIETDEEEEFVQQSTVQYLLCDDDQSDSELTFDDIRNTLENIKTSSNSMERKEVKKKLEDSTNGLIPTKSSVRHMMRPNIMQTHRKSKNMVADSKPNYLKDSMLHIEDFGDAGKENSVTSTSTERSELKVKRPRKQKLTIVNRGDSEIIIQPASMIDEEEDLPVKKRNRRKRKVLPDPDYNPRTPTKKIRKLRKHSRVEVIDIDMDEENNHEPVEEITIDDGKEKNSSDKENNVIMVGDSDEDSQESSDKSSTPVLRCQFCSRNFRQKRLLDTHVRICPKARSKKIDSVKREFTCKTCKEKFDAALTLARHVRANHSQKRGRPRKIILSSHTDEDEDDLDDSLKLTSPEKVVEKSTKDVESKKSKAVKMTRSVAKAKRAAIAHGKRKKKSKKSLTVKNKKKSRLMNIHCCRRCLKVFPTFNRARTHYMQHLLKSTLKNRRIRKDVAALQSKSLCRIKGHRKEKLVQIPKSIEKVTKPIVKEEEPPVTPRKRGRPRKVKPAD